MEKITVEISKEGITTVSVTGVKGKRCVELTEELERELGQVSSEAKTSEYYEQPLTQEVKH